MEMERYNLDKVTILSWQLECSCTHTRRFSSYVSHTHTALSRKTGDGLSVQPQHFHPVCKDGSIRQSSPTQIANQPLLCREERNSGELSYHMQSHQRRERIPSWMLRDFIIISLTFSFFLLLFRLRVPRWTRVWLPPTANILAGWLAGWLARNWQ